MFGRWLPNTILDDSQPPRPVPLWNPADGADEGSGPGPQVRARIASALRYHTQLWLSSRLRLEHLAGGTAAVSTGLVFALALVPILGDRAMAVAIGAALLAGSAAAAAVARRRSAPVLRATLLASGCCASCGCPLGGGAAPDESARVTCPECGAVWRLPEPRVGGSAHASIGDQPQPVASRWLDLAEALSMSGHSRKEALTAPDARSRIVELVYPIRARRPARMWHSISEHDRALLKQTLWSLTMSHRGVGFIGAASVRFL
jgi:hypothetical protein